MRKHPYKPACTCPDDHRALIDGNYIVSESGCWEWQGRRSEAGYGLITHHRLNYPAHRMSYWALVGDFPAELTIDHLCRNRGCVNPAHLEPVTQRENVLRSDGPTAKHARQETCKNGHPLTAGHRQRRCLVCETENRHAWIRTNPPLEPDDPRHGTLYGYQSFRCRCDLCRAANAARRREHRARAKEAR